MVIVQRCWDAKKVLEKDVFEFSKDREATHHVPAFNFQCLQILFEVYYIIYDCFLHNNTSFIIKIYISLP